jgi:isopenicillin N synthase-like dioxygenase
MDPSAIPVIDHADLVSDRPEALARAAEAIATGLGTYGLVYVRGHEIVRAEVLELYDHFLELLSRPVEEKRTWGGPEIWYQRGWTPPNTEQAVIAGGQPDFKECWFTAPMPLDPLCKRWFPEVYTDNVWPADAESFRALQLAIGRALHLLGTRLLRACEHALDVPAGSLTSKTTGGAHVSRLLKYLELDAEQAKRAQAPPGQRILWGEEHTDFNVLTLLPGGCFYRDGERGTSPDDGGGLFLRTPPTADNPAGELIRGRAPEGCVVAQVGQQLEVLSGGRFLATPHVITAPSQPGWVRTSLAHFVHLNGRERVEPLPECRADAGDAYAPPVLAGNYAMKTLVDIGLAPEETLQRLGYRHYARLAGQRQSED